ncbi:hypothetical protein Pfo_026633 [Paulownia fortunei]|nr:hypothetical protein Pfo_026633 [Paulownia fortunei]
MVVLDDLWEIDHWDGLKHGFLVEGLKSKILLTTRKQNVADKGFAFELGLLNIDDGLELLKKKAFPQSRAPDFAIEENLLQKIGKEMVRKCRCLPLVISLLGGVLSKKKSMKEREFVNENVNAYLYRGEGIQKENEIHGVLNLSYEDLPYYLKPCFLFMGQFREDQTIYANILYRLWIAEGMISHENQENEETLMDIAELYLSELASRCIVQVQDFIPEEKYRSCQLHDVVRELCLSKGKKEDFCSQVMDYRSQELSTLLYKSLPGIKPRHLAIHFEREIELECVGFTINHEGTSKQVRSLQFLNDLHGKKIEFPHSIIDFQKFKLLRVLVFQNFDFVGRKLPRGIGNLIHLRHLCLRKCGLDELPSSICNLTYLYTLD